ncbi:putative NADPH:quinone reductase [Clavispora lusitaniae]|uniref:Probable quinone oxidoreductase n=1 Tax=Clavispora lusitaniae TaxID=36911 RepID=A0AA91PX91_CLALS|nr:putative NADPH:quinone reductase [Clavispora lusitaniae]
MFLPATQKAAFAPQLSESVDGIVYGDIETPKIESPDDVIVKNKYAGVNFIESYFRKGIYPAQFPYAFGREAAGHVVAVGANVTRFQPGDVVAYLSPRSFAQYTKFSQNHVQVRRLASDVSDAQLRLWGSLLVQGLTAITFAHEAYEVKKGDFILVWAAAGGVGQILTSYAAHLGAHVIAVASNDEKLAIARSLGASYVIRSDEDVAKRVLEITGGVGVAASFDGIGKDTFEASMASLARKGSMVSYGNASGVVPPVSINRLSAKNIKLLRPQVFGYVTTAEEWEHYTNILQEALDKNVIDVKTTVYPLEEYREAAAALEGRKTTGKLVLAIPE